MKKFLGLICLLYSIVIGYVWIFDKLKNYLAPNMQMYLKLSLPLLLLMGIVLLKEKKDKFKVSDLILLLPIAMIILSSDGKLSSTYASNKIVMKQNIKKEVKEKVKEETNEDDDINIDKDNLKIYFDVIDKNYLDLAGYITFPSKDYDKYLNKTIKVRGMAVKKGEYIPDGYFQIGKYTITCCAADAELSYFYVKEDSNQIKENEWYEIEGILKKMVYRNTDVMYIKIINIKQIDSKNEELYVYPCYSYDDGKCSEFLKYHLND